MSVTVPLAVYIQQHYREPSLPSPALWEKWFQQWLDALKAELPKAAEYELTLCLSDDQQIQSLNAQYRQKNQPTDVLAFAALETPFLNQSTVFGMQEQEPLYLGDIIISVETAQQQAKERQHSLRQELTWLAVHGLLHLLGWDHPDEESLNKMLAQQETLLVSSGHK
ncbi:MAG: rRNA maturation RNase YbeY [Cyanobacteria bacterium SW_9_44_58]|jgi:probable rRNA maturation factor|nr:MAG: rRNA maturation RNase YbeY [Cyanobacteria bacterium SW_9_44_58]